jgi:hypothetical protein
VLEKTILVWRMHGGECREMGENLHVEDTYMSFKDDCVHGWYDKLIT